MSQEPVKVVRVAMFIDRDGELALVKCNLTCDPSRHLVPLWPMHIQLNGRTFTFEKETAKGRMVYREMLESETTAMTPQEEIESLEATCEMFHNSNIELSNKLNEAIKIIHAQSSKIKELETKLQV
jgi:hypothetical protein